jgi:hypothetical protein
VTFELQLNGRGPKIFARAVRATVTICPPPKTNFRSAAYVDCHSSKVT